MVNKFFKIKDRNSSIRLELVGGITTFLTMSYIIFLHPNMLAETGMDKGALITVTCLASFIGTLIVALYANVPFALAPGLGLNSFFTYTLVLNMGIPWQTSLGIVFISGILFLLLSLVGFREKIIQAIPKTLRLSVPVGIGLLITFIGLKNMGLIVSNEATMIQFGELTRPVLISLAGLMIIIVLDLYKVRGSILIGIFLIYGTGLITGDIQAPHEIISAPPAIAPIAFKLDVPGALSLSYAGVIFSFLYVDLFDSVGTILGCANEANMIDKDGRVRDAKKILTSDATATVFGSLVGTSTITTYIESASGIAAGARTGLSSVFTAFLFLMAPMFAPIIGSFPGFATAPALVIIGIYMFKIIYKIRFDMMIVGIPAFLTIVMMPFTGSISTGLSFGFLSYILLMVVTGKTREIPLTLWIIGLMTLLTFIV